MQRVFVLRGHSRFHRQQQFLKFQIVRIFRQRGMDQREVTLGVSRPVKFVKAFVSYGLHGNLPVIRLARGQCRPQRAMNMLAPCVQQ